MSRGMMNRRAFLKTIGAVVGAGVVAPTLAKAKPQYLLVDGAHQIGSTIKTTGAYMPFTRGDVITFAGVRDLNPITGKAASHLKRFVITADVTAGDNAIQIHPSIETLGPHRSTVESPANRALVVPVVPWLVGRTLPATVEWRS